MVFITHCDSPAFWKTYLSDTASITMEGILIFNKHLLFLLTVIVLFVLWLLFYTTNYLFLKLAEKRIWKVFLQDPRARLKSIAEYYGITVRQLTNWHWVVNIAVKLDADPKSPWFEDKVYAQIFQTNGILNIPAPVREISVPEINLVPRPNGNDVELLEQHIHNSVLNDWRMTKLDWSTEVLNDARLRGATIDVVVLNDNQPLPNEALFQTDVRVRRYLNS